MSQNVFNDFNNKQVAVLPMHLRQYIVEQHYENYTPVDHAVWRYVMRQNYSYLKDIAYYPYIPGLEKAGLTIEKIPNLQEMNAALGKIGWGAVTVDGFIPPAAFMEYQAYHVLVIAADIRQLKHIDYTPAPDIIHESAGHAPIIADKDYHEYLSYFGSIGAKAMFSAQDYDLYEAIRALSILKEMPDADASEIKKAEEHVAWCQKNLGEPSEMALLSRLHWWTVEYGLIGNLENPKIYGAGLLSSIGESSTCMSSNVKKLWYNIYTLNYSYDITKPQPQLFVTANFQNLIDVLEQFANTMAFRVGGTYGLTKAIASKNTCTVVLSSGLQISGTFTDTSYNETEQPAMIKTSCPTMLAYGNKQLPGHGKSFHKDGFSSPLGKLKGQRKALEKFSLPELANIGVVEGHTVTLEFESAIIVKGKVINILNDDFKTLLISFENCTVTGRKGELLFDPTWGTFDMAVGEKVVSVYSGAADKDAFDDIEYQPKTLTYHPTYDSKTITLHQLYQQVRDCRKEQKSFERLKKVWFQLRKNHREDWLCALEILEIIANHPTYHKLSEDIKDYLFKKAKTDPDLERMIFNGLNLVEQKLQ